MILTGWTGDEFERLQAGLLEWSTDRAIVRRVRDCRQGCWGDSLTELYCEVGERLQAGLLEWFTDRAVLWGGWETAGRAVGVIHWQGWIVLCPTDYSQGYGGEQQQQQQAPAQQTAAGCSESGEPERMKNTFLSSALRPLLERRGSKRLECVHWLHAALTRIRCLTC